MLYPAIINMILFKYFPQLLILLLHFEFLNAMECPTESDKKCEAFWHQLFKYPGHNLRKGLKCLNYNANITSVHARGNTSLQVYYSNYRFSEGNQIPLPFTFLSKFFFSWIWSIVQKFCLQKVGVTTVFYLTKVMFNFDFRYFLTMLSALWCIYKQNQTVKKTVAGQ